MSGASWPRVRALFERALEDEPVDPAAWVACEADGEPDVAADVLSLLDHHARAGAFLAEPVMPRLSDLLDDESPFAAGELVGPYTIEREIGRGGMGRVYLASDTRLGRSVALKMLIPSLTRDPLQRERLRREARAAAALTHPGICTVYALEEIGDEVFIAAEYVDGPTLREEIVRGYRPDPPEIRQTLRALADALAAAHAQGIVHRDLKPENVMRGRDGRIRILDFGLALGGPASDGQAARMTLPGAVLGTPAYMSPEQLNGQVADARSDMFALGLVIFELAAGVHPFAAGTELARAARVLQGNADAVRSMRPDLPAELASVIDRCLQREPDDRFAAASDIVRALDNGVRDQSTVVRANTPGHDESGVTGWWRRHQLVALGLYLAAAIAAWLIKEWTHGPADSAFLAVGVAAVTGGMFRGHLLFTERMNRRSFEAERRRAARVTLVADLVIAGTLWLLGWRVSIWRPVAGVLTLALAVGIAVTRLVIERATTRAAFEP